MGTVGDWLLAAGLSGGLAQARPRLVSHFSWRSFYSLILWCCLLMMAILML
jgi:hypothetical protein